MAVTSVTIQLFGKTATTEGVEWDCTDPETEELLNMLADPFMVKSESGRLYFPDMAIEMAELAVKKLGAKITKVDREPSKPGTVY